MTLYMIHYILYVAYISQLEVKCPAFDDFKKRIMGRNQGNTLGRYIELDFIGGNMIMCMICATRKYIK